MSSRPLVSVCIPSYNGAAFIGQTIQSVLNQTFTNFELIVCDDFSNDETVSVVKGFHDARIRVVQNERNLGLAGNWNKILSLELGKYVKLLCEDDLLHPDCLSRQVQVLENSAYSGVVLTFCDRDVINDRDEVVLASRKRGKSPGLRDGVELIRASIRVGTNLIGEPVVALFRREAIKSSVMCNPANAFLSDLNLWAELLRSGDAFFDPTCLASFRISREAATAKIGLRQAAYFREFAKRLHDDPFYRVSFPDLLSSYLLSFPLCLLRNAFIKLRTTPITASFPSHRFPERNMVKQSEVNIGSGSRQENLKNSSCGRRNRNCFNCS